MRRWSVLAGSSIGMAVSVGPIFWLVLGLYLKPMTAEFGWSRTDFAVVFSSASVANALMLPVAGYLVDRYGPRRVILAGMTSLCLAVAGMSLVHSYPALIALACVVAVTGCTASYPAYLALPPQWFDKRLGLSLAIASSGIGVGGAIFPHIINASLAARGWRETFVVVAVIAFAIGIANWLLLIRENTRPIPMEERRQLGVHEILPAVTFREAMRSGDFWMTSIGFGLVFLVTIGINFHFAALIGDRGGSAAEAASAVAALGLASLAGRLVTGALLDRVSVRAVAVIFFLGQAIGCALLFRGGSGTTILAAILLGAAQGAELDMLPYVVVRRFGKVAYAQIYGTAYAVLQIGQITSPIILATIFDRTGSYAVGLMLYPVLSLVALALVWRARTAPKIAGYQDGGAVPSAF